MTWNIRCYWKVLYAVLFSGNNLKIVAAMSAGYNHIDAEELKRKGVQLSNTPTILNEAVADVGILLALAASRRLNEGLIAIKK